MIALLDHDDLVCRGHAPAVVAAIVVHLGTGAVPAVMMAAALDDDGLGVCAIDGAAMKIVASAAIINANFFMLSPPG